ncbi:hypothetical protein PCC8801_0622 [Rippkaea orientalis PCC 8801]|uniref:Uncharacterized protein n=1 Tax=Rippkaea orientalis (strain PCC 8801 / RF-1) TaxID=41431 RepID=B7JXF3_RIPO1|nr:hypothetical protein PCC8801_0622 [Rippkaea orientalis PCC 8801]
MTIGVIEDGKLAYQAQNINSQGSRDVQISRSSTFTKNWQNN